MTFRGTRLDPVSNQTAEAVARVAKILGFYLQRQHEYAASRNHEPTPTSAAAQVAEDAVRRTPYELAALLTLMANDHLRTVGATLDAGVIPSWGLHSLLRVVLETSARAWWMLAPDLDADTRAARGLLARLEMLRERAKLEAGAGNAPYRIQELIAAARQAGFVVDLKDGGAPKKVNGAGYADTTAVLRQMLPDTGPNTGLPFGEFLYRLLSGATHGNEWMAVLNAEPMADLPNDGLTLARTAPDFPRVAGLLTAAVRANATAFDRQCQLNGWTSLTGQPFYIHGVLGRFGDAIGAFEE